MSHLSRADILELHAALVGIASVSGSEEEIVTFVAQYLQRHGLEVDTLERNVIARPAKGGAPRLLLNSHLDTVPPSSKWTREPWDVARAEGRVYGLGSNDAKASVAAMMVTLIEQSRQHPARPIALTLVADEETGGRGTELVLPELKSRAWPLEAAVVGEPTGLNVAVAQKGMLILQLIAEGDVCHSANANAMGARNAVFELARDLTALEGERFGGDHPILGQTSLQPTITRAGHVRNALPGEASSFLDLRTVPGDDHDGMVEKIRARVENRVEVISKRLVPRECPAEHPLIAAAKAARPEARLYGSPTMSDWVFFEEIPAIKVGPGQSVRSHTPDEYVEEHEVLEGAAFYAALIDHYFS